MNSVTKELRLKSSVRYWYMTVNPDDDYGSWIRKDLTFEGVVDALGRYEDVYRAIGITDSLIREKIFAETAKRCGVDYNVLYRRWLHQDGNPGFAGRKVLDCSIFGDRRFNGAFAMLEINGEARSINDWYCQSRRLVDGSTPPPGEPFDHVTDPFTGVDLPREDVADLYRGLWVTYLERNPELVSHLEEFDEIMDSSYDPDTRGTSFADKNPDLNNESDIIGSYVFAGRESFTASLHASHWYQATEAYRKKPLAEKVLEFLEQENTLFWHDQGLPNPGSREGGLQLIAKDLASNHVGWYAEEIRALGNSCFHLRPRARAIVAELEAKKEPLSTRIAAASRRRGFPAPRDLSQQTKDNFEK